MSHTYTVLYDWMLKNKWYFKGDQTKISSKLFVLVDEMAYIELF